MDNISVTINRIKDLTYTLDYRKSKPELSYILARLGLLVADLHTVVLNHDLHTQSTVQPKKGSHM